MIRTKKQERGASGSGAESPLRFQVSGFQVSAGTVTAVTVCEGLRDRCTPLIHVLSGVGAFTLDHRFLQSINDLLQ